MTTFILRRGQPGCASCPARGARTLGLAAILPGASFSALAADAPAVLNSGDTSWLLVSSVLVLMMLVPGLTLFYGGMARTKNVLSLFTQCFAIAGVIGLLWTVYGYSLAFGDTTGMQAGTVNLHSFIGGFGKLMLHGVGRDSLTGTIPESLFAMFQLTFACITPAIIAGAFAERMKFSSVLLFSALWTTFCYIPLAHMAWSGPGGLLFDWGILEFAGGTVVHINAGVAGLVAALALGPRKGYPQTAMPPHNLVFTLAGAALLWVGWFGFNVGSAVAANDKAGMATLTTQIAASTGILGWLLAEWIRNGKPSALGAASGALAGLVGITPACGFVGPSGALVIGFVAALSCFFAIGALKRRLGYDDSFDAFGLHGVGGIVGSILTGVFAPLAMGGFEELALASQLWIQVKSVLFTVAYCAMVTWVLLKITGLLTAGLRVSAEQEQIGLDQTEHSERAYNP
ncbi:ammonium transporter [Verminephrobacter aporrectodeae]|uniref:ammonium transporter n=1 Tax=Verminephrobacter aporrectodeae TaxID=1110389 RepID=UPI002244A016|nr:ammonium transporter [Verminephrobacter aporrectodeae]MCW8173843.1 ammonium transporter [Verminephrobacter aporrectodeae subsp. tuberculatae]MCW8201414.1 ammonium transporter [Verminephrobacter aporrectodeae subsp. tuberculatae]